RSCFLCNQQRHPVAALFRLAVSLLAAMAAGADRLGVARSRHWFGRCRRVPDEVIDRAADCSRAGCGFSKTATDPSTDAAGRSRCTGCAVFFGRDPNWVWVVWTKIHFGDATGSTEKVMLLGWTGKPFHDWWQHPIFTP